MPPRPYLDNPFEPSNSRVDVDDYYGDVPVSVLASLMTFGLLAKTCIFILWLRSGGVHCASRL